MIFPSPDEKSIITTATPYALTDKNLYTYCDNNPVMRTDNGGMFWSAVLLGGVIGVAFQYLSDVIDNVSYGKTVELTFKVFKYGVYSTISSTLFDKAVLSWI